MSQVTNPVLDEKWLKRAAWWVNHQEFLRRLLIGLVIIVEAALLLYSLWGWADYLFISKAKDQAMLLQLSQSNNYAVWHARYAPQPLSAPVVALLPGSSADGRYNALVKFSNTSAQWLAVVHFRVLSSDSLPTQEETIQLLNNDEHFIVVPGVAQSLDAALRVETLSVEWQRVREPAVLTARLPNFTVTDVKYLSSSDIGLKDASDLGQVRFTVKNDGALGYWTSDFTVVLLQGDTPQAASTTSLEKFRPGEVRNVSLNFLTPVTAISKVLVVPFVNIADDSVIMDTTGPSSKF